MWGSPAFYLCSSIFVDLVLATAWLYVMMLSCLPVALSLCWSVCLFFFLMQLGIRQPVAFHIVSNTLVLMCDLGCLSIVSCTKSIFFHEQSDDVMISIPNPYISLGIAVIKLSVCDTCIVATCCKTDVWDTWRSHRRRFAIHEDICP